MAGTERSIEDQKAILIAELNNSRRDMSAELDDVANVLDLPNQFRESFRTSSWQWLSAALIAGAVTGLVLGSTTKGKKGGKLESKKRSLALSALGMAAKGAFELAKPTLGELAIQQLEKLTKEAFKEK